MEPMFCVDLAKAVPGGFGVLVDARGEIRIVAPDNSDYILLAVSVDPIDTWEEKIRVFVERVNAEVRP